MKIKAQCICTDLACNWTDLKYFVHNNCHNCLLHHIACIIYPTELYRQSGLIGRLTEPARMVYQVQEEQQQQEFFLYQEGQDFHEI